MREQKWTLLYYNRVLRWSEILMGTEKTFCTGDGSAAASVLPSAACGHPYTLIWLLQVLLTPVVLRCVWLRYWGTRVIAEEINQRKAVCDLHRDPSLFYVFLSLSVDEEERPCKPVGLWLRPMSKLVLLVPTILYSQLHEIGKWVIFHTINSWTEVHCWKRRWCQDLFHKLQCLKSTFPFSFLLLFPCMFSLISFPFVPLLHFLPFCVFWHSPNAICMAFKIIL